MKTNNSHMFHTSFRCTYLLMLPLVSSLVACSISTRTRDGEPSSESKQTSQSAVKDMMNSSHASTSEGGGHDQDSGAHGGSLISIGNDNFHAEVISLSNGKVRLMMLGKDASRVVDIPSQTVTAFVQSGDGVANAEEILFQPESQPGDGEGRASQFVAELPQRLRGTVADITIPNLNIDGERFRVAFSAPLSSPQTTEHQPTMPENLAIGEAEKLYLTPGGLYTQSDIAANGHTTPTKKYKGILSAHNMKPQPGDRICPISGTKANSQFVWTIGGKQYQFCCTPCVDEFLQAAKEKPETIREPEDYVKQ